MNQAPIRLGPMALLLTVISICMTTLAILTFSTARADMRLAQKYALTVADRYELEQQGQEFLKNLSGTLPGGNTVERSDLEKDENGVVWKTFEKDGFRLRIGLRVKNGKYQVTAWKYDKEWEQDTEILELW